MEQRAHPRIQIPLLVELSHPAIGTVETTARDVSEGGLFVLLPKAKVKQGGKIKLRLLTVLPTDTQPTPTVEMEVRRVTDEGIGLAFRNKTAKHLWGSVERVRSELAVGQDYFQIHQCLAITHSSKGILLVQQHGKWMLPGMYLVVRQDPIKSLREFAEFQLGLTLPNKIAPHAVSASVEHEIEEAAMYSTVFVTAVSEPKVNLADNAPYKAWRWMTKFRDLGEITFASASQRAHAEDILQSTDTDSD